MPTYYFELDDNGAIANDNDGLEFAGPEEAYKEAVTALSEMSRDLRPEDGRKYLRMLVYDEEGNCIGSPELKYDPRGIYPQ